MPAEILDGRALAQQVRTQVAVEVAELTSRTGVVPGLTVVLVGDDPASQVYVRNKESAVQSGRDEGDRAAAAGRDHPGRAPGHDRSPERRSDGPWHPGPVASAVSDRRAAVVERLSPLKDVDGFTSVQSRSARGRDARDLCRARRWASANS